MPQAQRFWLWARLAGGLEAWSREEGCASARSGGSVHPWGVEQLECPAQRHLLGRVVGISQSQLLPQPPWALLALQERAD